MELDLNCAGAGWYGVNLSLYGSGYGGRNWKLVNTIFLKEHRERNPFLSLSLLPSLSSFHYFQWTHESWMLSSHPKSLSSSVQQVAWKLAMIRVFIPIKLVNVTNHGFFSLENQSLNIDHHKSGWDENKPVIDEGKQGSQGRLREGLRMLPEGGISLPSRIIYHYRSGLKTEN